MGIPRLYTHLRPYARPESFSAAVPAQPAQPAHSTPLFIDGPGFAHHVYQRSIHTAAAASSNPWESALSYREFQAAIIAYLDLLSAASFSIRKIYFDGHLPLTKRPTRHSRLSDSLHKLQTYHSQHAHILGSTHTALPAAPFIVLATLEALSSHTRYSHTVSTVRAEAESYCARDAIQTHGLVLTGDSDLLLFASADDWGVMMFRDVDVDAGPGVVSALVVRPGSVAASLCVDLQALGFQALRDPYVSFSVLRARAAGMVRDEGGGAAWREFAACYVLPEEQEEAGYCSRGVEPRIAEIVQQREEGEGEGGVKTMFLPFLWEDPTRGSAWDAGRVIRAAAYALLFPGGGAAVEEVCRRGQRIAAGAVQRVEDPAVMLGGLLRDGDGDGDWWVGVVLREITAVFENRGQDPPERRLLCGIAHMLQAPAGAAETVGWTWERVQLYALAQAAWYSLLLVKEVVSATSAAAADEEAWRRVARTLPGVSECIDGARFLAGTVVSGPAVKKAVERALEGNSTISGHSTISGNGKRPSDAGAKRRKRKAKKRAAMGGKAAGRGPLEGNMFSALA